MGHCLISCASMRKFWTILHISDFCEIWSFLNYMPLPLRFRSQSYSKIFWQYLRMMPIVKVLFHNFNNHLFRSVWDSWPSYGNYCQRHWFKEVKKQSICCQESCPLFLTSVLSSRSRSFSERSLQYSLWMYFASKL